MDDVHFARDGIAIGAFACPVGAANFRDTGPIERDIIVFPRHAVGIRHEGADAFTADASVITIYNRAQRYERLVVADDGDRCDWFAVDPSTVRELVARHDPEAAESDRPLRFARVDSHASLFARQRALYHRARRQCLEIDEGVEAVIDLFAAVVAHAYAPDRRVVLGSRAASRECARRQRHRDLAEAARAEIARTPERAESPAAMARRLGVSTFHLCRVFRAETGLTMHRYRTALRARRVLDWLDPSRPATTLSQVALATGFVSHAHLVKAIREHYGLTPGNLRRALLT